LVKASFGRDIWPLCGVKGSGYEDILIAWDVGKGGLIRIEIICSGSDLYSNRIERLKKLISELIGE
jgi:hypothetical protein